VTPVPTTYGFVITGIGPDPTFGEIACKQGRTTANLRRHLRPGQDPAASSCRSARPGDSGAPVTVNNLLVGMIHGAFSDNLSSCVTKYHPGCTPRR